MNTPHKHADWIKRWADGEAIEWRQIIDQRWHQVFEGHDWRAPGAKYSAAKPKLRYRVALMCSDGGDPWTFIGNDDTAVSLSEHRMFQRWLTDWTEYEA